MPKTGGGAHWTTFEVCFFSPEIWRSLKKFLNRSSFSSFIIFSQSRRFITFLRKKKIFFKLKNVPTEPRYIITGRLGNILNWNF